MLFAETVPASAEESPRPVRRLDELYVGQAPDVWQLTIVVDGQIRRRIVVADGKACVEAAMVLALGMSEDSTYDGVEVRLFCGASRPGYPA